MTTTGANMPIRADNLNQTVGVTDEGLQTIEKLQASLESAVSARIKNGFFVEDNADLTVNLKVTNELADKFRAVRNEALTVLNTSQPPAESSGVSVVAP